jgi:glutaredoxin-related protein
MWICRTTKIKPSAEGFASAHQVHHQHRTVFEEEGGQYVEKDCQFGYLNFSYKSGVVSPMTAYRNKWPSDWQQHWLYHTVTPPATGESHPLATKELPPLHESYAKNPSCPEGDEFVMMLRRFARKYSTRDIMEEYRNIPVCLLVDGWAVADDAWATDIGGIPCPDWTKAFSFTSACECLCALRSPTHHFPHIRSFMC